jgi:hypothetical protein
VKMIALPPEPSAFVFRGSPSPGKNGGPTVPRLHAGAAVTVGATATGAEVAAVAAFVVVAFAIIFVGDLVGWDAVTVGSGVTVAGSDVDVTGA